MKTIKTINTSKTTKKREKLISLYNNFNDISLNYNYNYELEIQYIQKLYLDISFNERPLIIRELRSKQSSYKRQDMEKKIYNKETFITIEDIIEKLLVCYLRCLYCEKKIKILYENVRDPLQWTLDRKNNNEDHSNKNTIISCLQCNLQRRKKCMEAFQFTKQLKIVKNN